MMVERGKISQNSNQDELALALPYLTWQSYLSGRHVIYALDMASQCQFGIVSGRTVNAHTRSLFRPEYLLAARTGAQFSHMNAQSIFVIDDNPDFRMLCRQALKTQGFACQTFEDGSKALDSLKSLDLQLPDLVFVDLTMPGMDGETFLREVRANERTQNLKVVVTSGWDNIKERADQAGADGFLKKPFDLTTLFKFVRARLSEPSL